MFSLGSGSLGEQHVQLQPAANQHCVFSFVHVNLEA